jgi:hypothetical protein
MINGCVKCGEHIDGAWVFCARCGAKVERAAANIALAGHQREPAPVTGAFGGAALGLIAAPIGLVFGIMLCLTGLGMVIGIPVIILSILSPLAGPLLGLGAAKDKVL